MASWTRDLSLNHEQLDAEHAEQFGKISEAIEALDGPRARLEAAVASLEDALVAHIATEERLMDEVLYPERLRHRSAHELFMAEFARMRDELRHHGATPLVAELLRRRLPEWLRFHIHVNDIPLGKYLTRNRAQAATPARAGKDRSRRLS